MAAVRTTEGNLTYKAPSTHPLMTPEQAESDAADRNKRAEELGIKTRYVASED